MAAHQALDALARYAHAAMAELGVHAWGAVAALTLRVDLVDQLGEADVVHPAL